MVGSMEKGRILSDPSLVHGAGGGPEEEDEHGFKKTLRGVLVLSRSDTLWFISLGFIFLDYLKSMKGIQGWR